GLLTDPTIADAALRPALLALRPAEHDLFPSRAAGVRWQLHEKARHVRPLLKALLTLPLAGDERAPLVRACAPLRDLYQRQARALPVACDSRFAPRWTALVDQPDRHRARRAFEAATLLALRQALRNGSVWLEHSLALRQRDAMLLPEAEWTTPQRRFYAPLGLPRDAAHYTPQLLANLEAGLVSLAEAVDAGVVVVDDRGLHLKALDAEETPPQLGATRDAIFQEVGTIQLPEFMLAV